MNILSSLLKRFFVKSPPVKYDPCLVLLDKLTIAPHKWQRAAYTTWEHVGNTLPEAIAAVRHIAINISKPHVLDIPRPVNITLIDFMTDANGKLCSDSLLLDYVTSIKDVLDNIPDNAEPAKEVEYNYIRGMLLHEVHCMIAVIK